MNEKEILKVIKKFNEERNWSQFHSKGNLAKSISIEANELLEIFQWSDDSSKIDKIKDELADILIYAINLADKCDIDLEKAILEKLKINEEKYPVNKAFGNSKKYDEF